MIKTKYVYQIYQEVCIKGKDCNLDIKRSLNSLILDDKYEITLGYSHRGYTLYIYEKGKNRYNGFVYSPKQTQIIGRKGLIQKVKDFIHQSRNYPYWWRNIPVWRKYFYHKQNPIYWYYYRKT